MNFDAISFYPLSLHQDTSGLWTIRTRISYTSGYRAHKERWLMYYFSWIAIVFSLYLDLLVPAGRGNNMLIYHNLSLCCGTVPWPSRFIELMLREIEYITARFPGHIWSIVQCSFFIISYVFIDHAGHFWTKLLLLVEAVKEIHIKCLYFTKLV